MGNLKAPGLLSALFLWPGDSWKRPLKSPGHYIMKMKWRTCVVRPLRQEEDSLSPEDHSLLQAWYQSFPKASLTVCPGRVWMVPAIRNWKFLDSHLLESNQNKNPFEVLHFLECSMWVESEGCGFASSSSKSTWGDIVKEQFLESWKAPLRFFKEKQAESVDKLSISTISDLVAVVACAEQLAFLSVECSGTRLKETYLV